MAGTFTDPRDGKTYKIVIIGRQIWMAENLNFEASGSKSYNNNPTYAQKYGLLYDWETAKKACPSGWHLPSDAEWQELVNFAGGDKIAGTKLKARDDWRSITGIPSGTDNYGFSAIPGGICSSNGEFDQIGIVSCWWSSSEIDDGNAYRRFITYGSEKVSRFDFHKNYLFSVRCVQD